MGRPPRSSGEELKESPQLQRGGGWGGVGAFKTPLEIPLPPAIGGIVQSVGQKPIRGDKGCCTPLAIYPRPPGTMFTVVHLFLLVSLRTTSAQTGLICNL